MEKNYYEILEVDKNASPEIIKKAYSTLAKKYHPDLQPDNLKEEYGEKLKLINQAYDVLSDPTQKEKYDRTLKFSTISEDEFAAIFHENEQLKNSLRNIQHQNNNPQKYQNCDSNKYENSSQNINENIDNSRKDYSKQAYKEYLYNIEQARRKAYHDAYIQDMKARGYKIRYKKTFKDYFISFVSLTLTALILFILWQIPFIRNLVLDNFSSLFKF